MTVEINHTPWRPRQEPNQEGPLSGGLDLNSAHPVRGPPTEKLSSELQKVPDYCRTTVVNNNLELCHDQPNGQANSSPSSEKRLYGVARIRTGGLQRSRESRPKAESLNQTSRRPHNSCCFRRLSYGFWGVLMRASPSRQTDCQRRRTASGGSFPC